MQYCARKLQEARGGERRAEQMVALLVLDHREALCVGVSDGAAERMCCSFSLPDFRLRLFHTVAVNGA